jgi:hypothetical protein
MSTHRLVAVTDIDHIGLAAAAGLAAVEAHGLVALLLPARKPLAAWLQTRKAEMSGLLAFQRLLESLSAKGPMLPAAYGSALITAEDAEALLVANAAEIGDAFETFGGLLQFQVEVRWDAAKAMVRFKQDGLFSGLDAALATRDRQAFGAAVQALMEVERQRLALGFVELLGSAALDLVRLPLADEAMVLNAAALIARSGEPALDRAVEAIDATMPEALTIRQLGPLPAVSFATIAIVEPDAGKLAAARHALGVSAEARPHTVKMHYRMAMREAHPDAGATAASDAAAALAQAHALALRAAMAPRSTAGKPLLLDIRREGDSTARQAA